MLQPAPGRGTPLEGVGSAGCPHTWWGRGPGTGRDSIWGYPPGRCGGGVGLCGVAASEVLMQPVAALAKLLQGLPLGFYGPWVS